MIETSSTSPYRRFAAFLNRHREGLITLLGVVSLIFFLSFYDRAFPSAAIDLTLSRADIKARAEAALADRGYDLADYQDALTFRQSSWASYYLQQTLGIPAMNRLIAETDLPIWTWQARWFRPLQKEAFYLSLDPRGEVVGFTHTILEDAPGAALAEDEARALAEAYLTGDRGWDLAAWEAVSASSEARPGGRVDHDFVWKQRDWDVGESQVRLSVTVQGDEIGSYDYWLKVPETFQRTFAEKQSVASFIDAVSLMGTLVLAGTLFLLALWMVHWQVSPAVDHALVPGAATAVVVLAARLNALPLAKAWYGTTQDYTLFWINQLIGVVAQAVFFGSFVMILWIMGHWMGQRAWPRQDRILARRGDRWRHLARSGWRGLMLSWMLGGYLVLFYLVATQLLGGWSPIGPDYTSAYATPLPFLGALESGLVPALTEELLWRLVLISGLLWFLHTFTRLPKGVRVALALVVPAVLWGFAHSTYVRDPITFRGIELTLAAILFEGLFFLHFDLTTTIVAHFAYNAGLGAIPLLRSGDPYFVASGAVVLLVMVAPMLPYLVMALRRRLRGEPLVEVEPSVGPASAEDAAALAALPVEGVDWAALLDDPGGAVFVLRAGDETLGVAAGRMTGGDAGELLAVFVDPAWRRRYWGSDLLVALRRALCQRGAETLRCRVDVKHGVARHFIVHRLWTEREIVYQWPPEPRALPPLREVLARLRFWRRERDEPAPLAGQPPGYVITPVSCRHPEGTEGSRRDQAPKTNEPPT